ncbi:MAG: Gfo/Idh/MocA family oxidoreductase [Deltaproteobacteria bacterium]|nr:Gfo/Idh/MocA family oxidoreductase [Deltaproteobacteria bacterium]
MLATSPLRIGTLGAARITPMALLRPALAVPEVAVTAVAARDPERARRFAAKHGIARVHTDYAALIADPELDAIYNPLPNSHHYEWTIRALEAGKHVLCEKPLAANAAEAERMAQAAAATGRVLMEAFHYRYHPAIKRLKEITDSGELGRIRHIETHMCVPLLRPGDIRYRYDLAGGATMDLGCYTISLLRYLAAAEPEVTRAQARLSSPNLDRYMRADFRFADGRTGHMTCSLFSTVLLRLSAVVRGDRGEVSLLNPWLPHLYHRLTWRTERGTTVERLRGEATYTYQLRAFAAAVCERAAVPTDATEAIANLRVIDAVYRAAGLPPRVSS